MIFKNKKISTDVDVTIDGTNITEAKVTKFLRLMVDNKLSLENHIYHVSTNFPKQLLLCVMLVDISTKIPLLRNRETTTYRI